MGTLNRAIEIAAASHEGQFDKAGQPYILHPLRVMMSVSSLYEKIAAALHDVVEDTPWTLAQLAEEGFPGKVVDAVEALTKRKGESRMDAAKRAKANVIARVVKRADVSDNLDLGRIPEPTEKDYKRIEEYKKIKEFLDDAQAT